MKELLGIILKVEHLRFELPVCHQLTGYLDRNGFLSYMAESHFYHFFQEGVKSWPAPLLAEKGRLRGTGKNTTSFFRTPCPRQSSQEASCESWRSAVLSTTPHGLWRLLSPVVWSDPLMSTEPQSRRSDEKPRCGLCFQGCHIQPWRTETHLKPQQVCTDWTVPVLFD